MTTREAAERWGTRRGNVVRWCQKGNIPGAKVVGNTWFIPDNAQKPDTKPGRPLAWEPPEEEEPVLELPEPPQKAPTYLSKGKCEELIKTYLQAVAEAYRAYNPEGVYLAASVSGDVIRVNNSFWSYDCHKPIDMRWEVDSNGNAGEGQGDSSGVHGAGTED